MRHAETVTFGGSALDRAGEIRANPQAIAEARAHPDARAIVLWRGKPLIVRIRPTILMRLPMDHPILQDATDAPIFLGREDGAPRFAFDLSKWEPDQTDMAALGGFLDPSEQHHPTLDDLEVFAELRRIMTCSARATRNWPRPPRRSSAGTTATGSVPNAARPARSPMPDGGGPARPVTPATFPHRPRGYHADHARQFRSDGALARLA